MYFPAYVRAIRGYVSHPDILLQIRRRGTAGDLAGFLSIDPNRIAIARRGTIDHFKTGELFPDALFSLAQEHVATQKVALLEFRDPAQVGFEKRGFFIQFVPVECESRFQSQCVARAKIPSTPP